VSDDIKSLADRANQLGAMNNALCDFARRWKLDGDWLVCKKCKRPHIASKADQRFVHESNCKADSETHPWLTPMKILTPLYAAPVSSGPRYDWSVSGMKQSERGNWVMAGDAPTKGERE
jgi:hypothetical protein